MSDKSPFVPLSTGCVKNLQDKLQDKRKLGAQEVERLVHEFNVNGDKRQLDHIIHLMINDFISSNNYNMRIGGLVGLASIAIGLGKSAPAYAEQLIIPAVRSMHDKECRVNFYACEALYNIVKVLKVESLPFFLDLFRGLCKGVTQDNNVRSCCEQLDILLRSIVADNPKLFPTGAFVNVVREHIYQKNNYLRRLIVLWLLHLLTLNDLHVARYTCDLLDGILCILKDAPQDTSLFCSDLLDRLLISMNRLPPDLATVPYSNMMELLIIHCKWATSSSTTTLYKSTHFKDPLAHVATTGSVGEEKLADMGAGPYYAAATIQRTTLNWMKVFLQRSGPSLVKHYGGIASAIIPCLTTCKDESRRIVYDAAKQVNEELIYVIKKNHMNNVNNDSTNDRVEDMTLDVSSFMNVVCHQLTHPDQQIHQVSLQWICILLGVHPLQVLQKWEEVVGLLLSTLSQSDAANIQSTMKTIRQMCLACHEQNYHTELPLSNVSETLWNAASLLDDCGKVDGILLYFMSHLVQSFTRDPTFLDQQGNFVISYLCEECNCQQVYGYLAEIILAMPDNDVAMTTSLVKFCNRCLLTQIGLSQLRNKLHHLRDKSVSYLFTRLYRAWCYHPISLLSLCLLTQNYQHSSVLVKYFGKLEVTVDNLTEMDRLIQLIESPIFSSLRLHLLDVRHSHNLQETLYSVLMCLPQTEAFLILQRRLDCIPSKYMLMKQQTQQLHQKFQEQACIDVSEDGENNIDFSELLSVYCQMQEKLVRNR